MRLRILHTNDFHGHLDDARLARLKELRGEVDVYFDSGDAVRYGNVALPVRQDPVWERLAQLDLTAQVPGNREFHVSAPVMRGKLRGAHHPIVCANLFDREEKAVFPGSIVVETAGVKIGVLGVTVPMVTSKMKSRHISSFLMTDPISAARIEARKLRGEVDVLIALTHIGVGRDQALAMAVPDLDMILGGHSHTLLAPVDCGGVHVAQTKAFGHFAGVYEWDGKRLVGEMVPLDRESSSEKPSSQSPTG